jgi:hypothetical protein
MDKLEIGSPAGNVPRANAIWKHNFDLENGTPIP